MGAPMVRRLLAAGLQVRVWNRTPEKLKDLIAGGAIPARSAADAANNSDAVLLCVTDATAVDKVLFQEEGVANAVNAPSLLVDFSTIGPEATVELAGRLRKQCGTSWVDAPVSGGATGAENGKLVIFCGGSAEDIARLAPIFGVLAQRATHIGDLGAGQTLKLCNQLIVATNLVAIAESLNLARASGLNLGAIPDALAGGFADSLPMQIFGRRMAQGVTTPVLGELALMLKDLRAVDRLARAHQSDVPMTRTALEIYRQAGERGLLRQDLAALFSLYAPPKT
jgi:3-hydroxyisobutyrate dehydrogenase